MPPRYPVTRGLLALLVTFQCCVPPTATSGEILGRVKRLLTETSYHGTKPAMGYDSAMECLAENIDWLEHHIDTYGSVVAKQPDIWGEARLTKHRDEYERMMFGELGRFNDTINAAVTQRDNAFLAQAFALSTAASKVGTGTRPTDGGAAAVTVEQTTATLQDISTSENNYKAFGIDTAPDSPRIKVEPIVHLDQMSRYLQHLHELRRINEGDDTSDSPGYSLNLVRIPVSITPGKLTREGFGAEITITAEPVISDDLMPTTFQNLTINDVVDFVGLPLVRVTERLDTFRQNANIPASRRLFEISVAQINKMVDDHNKMVDDHNKMVADHNKMVADHNKMVADFKEMDFNSDEYEAAESQLKAAESQLEAAESQLEAAESQLKKNLREPVRKVLDNDLLVETLVVTYKKLSSRLGAPIQTDNGSPSDRSKDLERAASILLNSKPRMLPSQNAPGEFGAQKTMVQDLLKAIEAKNVDNAVEVLVSFPVSARSVLDDFVSEQLLTLDTRLETAGVPVSSGRTRRALEPLSPSMLIDVVGLQNLVTISGFFNRAYYGRSVRWSGGMTGQDNCYESRVDLLDARRYLRSEAQAAYELLASPAHVQLYAKLASPHSMLAAQIRSGHLTENRPGQPCVMAYRNYFFKQLHNHSGVIANSILLEPELVPEGVIAEGHIVSEIESQTQDGTESQLEISEAKTPVEALAWAIVVESALLNERLNRDVRKLAKSKEVFSLNTEKDYWFFLPDTVDTIECGNEWLQSEFQAANEIFKEYVRQRWPIHVFAVDPVNQDQNVADVSDRKRELQFALALGFATGQIGANSLTQYSRALDTQIETIALNRTIVGFGHGSDTFGWRFYPRVQGLDAPGTFGTIRETLMGTPRDYDLKQRKIEPGQRECIAIVLMPSFVPYADFDIRTDWFKLTNPKNTALTMKDSLKLSRAVTAMRNSRAQCAEYQHLYREGELRRLLKRVDQLDRELPLQTMRALVPYENTLGGFEMFNTGVTDLSPELIGWYGAPGVRTFGTNCGCRLGCLPAPGTTCNNPQSCKELNDALRALNATIAASPVPTCDGEGTTLFLVGDNFSVHDTKVIAGGTCIPHVRLISRELMQVTIPSCVNTVELCEGGVNRKYVAVYVATPYGVTNHLHIPIMEQSPTACCSSSGVTQAPRSVLDRHTVSLSLATDASTQGTLQPSAPTSLASDHMPQPPIRLSSMLQEVTEPEEALTFATLSKQIEDLRTKIDTLTPAVSQTQVDVNVRYPQPTIERNHRGLFDEKELPMLNRLRSSATEHWRNYRDQLPGN